mmetsp:Transcript_47153/g.93030  ORF Transcript_47153/g.93030 Transcript_47153/m.93030 type:complete len:288 (-) Transcript_47153:196-1059(-)
MTLQNKKVAIRKERMRELKALKYIDREWEASIQSGEGGEEWMEVGESEREHEARLFLALLILCLEESPSKSVSLSSLEDSASGPIRSLVAWFEERQTVIVGTGQSGAGRNKKVSSPSELSLIDLSPFLDQHVFPDLIEGRGAGSRSQQRGEKSTYRPLRSRRGAKSEFPFPCAYCGSVDSKTKACSGCEMVSYCSPDCQKAHWSGKKEKGEKGGVCGVNTSLRERAEEVSAAVSEEARQPHPSETLPAETPADVHKKRCSLLRQRVRDVLLSQSVTFHDFGTAPPTI